jgi:hypothetical protein
MGKEQKIQNEGRNALALPGVFCTRTNVGTGWTGDKVVRIPGTRNVVIENARPFSTGLPEGFADTFGVVAVTITPDMVGQTIGQAFFVEYKADTKLKPIQAAFLAAMQRLGARAGVARSAAEAVAIAKGHAHVAS